MRAAEATVSPWHVRHSGLLRLGAGQTVWARKYKSTPEIEFPLCGDFLADG